MGAVQQARNLLHVKEETSVTSSRTTITLDNEATHIDGWLSRGYAILKFKNAMNPGFCTKELCSMNTIMLGTSDRDTSLEERRTYAD
jgi:hypothetical protein